VAGIKKSMELSIVVTSYRNPQLLKVCLDSIIECARGLEYELMVADSCTEEETEMMMREDYPEVKFFPFVENVGFQALVKKGIEAATGKYVLMLNGDIIVTPDSIQELLQLMRKDETVGMAGPKLFNFNGSLQFSCFRFYKPYTILYRRTFLGKFAFAKKHLDWFLMKDYNHETLQEVDWLMGSAIMLRTSAIAKVGLMDTRYFMYMEDLDWCRRFWEQGFKVVYFPLAKMHHLHGKGSSKGGAIKSLLSSKLAWVHIASAIKYFKKFWGKPLPTHN
jgi:GT2 family glycosyltransferase